MLHLTSYQRKIFFEEQILVVFIKEKQVILFGSVPPQAPRGVERASNKSRAAPIFFKNTSEMAPVSFILLPNQHIILRFFDCFQFMARERKSPRLRGIFFFSFCFFLFAQRLNVQHGVNLPQFKEKVRLDIESLLRDRTIMLRSKKNCSGQENNASEHEQNSSGQENNASEHEQNCSGHENNASEHGKLIGSETLGDFW